MDLVGNLLQRRRSIKIKLFSDCIIFRYVWNLDVSQCFSAYARSFRPQCEFGIASRSLCILIYGVVHVINDVIAFCAFGDYCLFYISKVLFINCIKWLMIDGVMNIFYIIYGWDQQIFREGKYNQNSAIRILIFVWHWQSIVKRNKNKNNIQPP